MTKSNAILFKINLLLFLLIPRRPESSSIQELTDTFSNPSNLIAKRNLNIVTIRDLLFADDAALVAHSAQDLQTLLNQFYSACSDFGFTISLNKTKILSQETNILPPIKINCKDIENVDSFVYLGSNFVSNASPKKK